jgi:signal transduction histidine kinase
MASLRDAPIRWKLKAILLVSSGGALLVAVAAHVVFDWLAFRQAAVRDLEVLARIASEQAAPAVVFKDPKAAQEILASLEAERQVVGAALYGADGRTFAGRVRPEAGPGALPAGPGPDGHAFTGGHLVLFRPVTAGAERVGSLFLRSDLSESWSRLRRNVLAGVGVLSVALIVAYVLGSRLEGLVIGPILGLADLARRVSRQRDYSARAPKESADELGQLVDDFNGMLAQIQLRDAALQQARDELERRVRARTAELEEAMREMESFAYSMSHDLRAPLRAMHGFSQALIEEYSTALDAKGRDYAGRIGAAAARMDSLIQDLLAYGRLSHEQIAPEPILLPEVVSDVLKQLAMEIRERRAEVRVEEPLPRVRAHRVTLGQVLTNLVTNALKFVAPGTEPRVRLRAERRDGRVRLWVEDNGIGVDPRHHERIFRVFERLHRVEDYPGTGIGLAIVRKGMERMEGAAGVESEPGRGSRFWIELPEA